MYSLIYSLRMKHSQHQGLKPISPNEIVNHVQPSVSPLHHLSDPRPFYASDEEQILQVSAVWYMTSLPSRERIEREDVYGLPGFFDHRVGYGTRENQPAKLTQLP